MQIPNWKCSTTHRLPAVNGSSACLRNQRTRGSSAFAERNVRARSTSDEDPDGEGEGEREGRGVTLRWDDGEETPLSREDRGECAKRDLGLHAYGAFPT